MQIHKNKKYNKKPTLQKEKEKIGHEKPKFVLVIFNYNVMYGLLFNTENTKNVVLVSTPGCRALNF